MNKIQIKQTILLLIASVLILFVYFLYPTEKNIEVKVDLIEEAQKDNENIVENVFQNILYNGVDTEGNPYEIGSEYAEIKKDNPDLTYMTTVTAFFYYKDRVVVITSDFAKYNKSTNDMLFNENVKMVDGANILYSNNLDVIATNKYVSVYNNVKFENPKSLMYADKIDIDLNTKTSIISMYDDGRVKMKLVK